VLATAACTLLLILSLGEAHPKDWPRYAAGNSKTNAQAEFVGATICSSCHSSEWKLWLKSHHRASMQTATDQTVYGNFNDVTFKDSSTTTTFFRLGSKFMVRTEGPDRVQHDYQIKFTFGVFPLQQFLIELGGGRLQALGVAWDSRPKVQGGQRWFFLFPGKRIKATDPLHWTGIDQNWNYMCADCHSTNVRRRYDPANRTFSTSYSEIHVSCEACHGPGSHHVDWARRSAALRSFDPSEGLMIAFNERRGVTWLSSPGSGEVLRNPPHVSDREIQMCARCHSRRGQIHEDYVHGQKLGDDYRVALLDSDLYFPDGQIKAENYEYGSFIQSRMFHAGVTCSDCHEPHSQNLRIQGNGLCLQCHSARKYDSSKHHFHIITSVGAQCISCHMPTRTYMVIDIRRDHSLRVPRPDQSASLGVPNACNNCHTNKSAQWASAMIKRFYGHESSGFQHFAEVLEQGEEGSPGASQSLTELSEDLRQPPIARATALEMLKRYSPAPANEVIDAAIIDPSALVRRAAATALSNSDLQTSAVVLAPLLDDPVRDVRLEAAEVLAGTPTARLPPHIAVALENAVYEYIESLELNGDRPEARMNLGLLFEKQHDLEKAEKQFKIALSLDPTFSPAALNLADLYRAEGRDRDGERVLDDATTRMPADPSVKHALGLLMVRQKQYTRGLELLASAAHADPTDARYAYVYAVALNDLGQKKTAIQTLEASIKLHPYDRASLRALVNFLSQSHEQAEEFVYAQRLEQLEPDDQNLQQLIARLRNVNAH
jgi:Flp pilus assembly protein TadD